MNPSMVLGIGTTIVLAYCIYYAINKLIYWKKLPPGPWGVPIFGSMIHLLRADLFQEFEKYNQKYGKIFSLGIGNFDVVVINDYKLIQQALKHDEFSGRPRFEIWIHRNMGFVDRGILVCAGNQTWQEQRRFALKNLRDFGLGKSSFEGLILHELEQLISFLKKDLGTPINLSNVFNASVFNSLWFILTGKRFELNDTKFKEIMSAFTVNLRNATVLGPGFFYPWPAKYNLIRRGLWKINIKNIERTLDLIDAQITEHEKSYNPNATRDFIDAYLHEMKQCQPNSSFEGEEGRRNLQVVMHDLFVAGTETTSTTLLWAIFYICQNPDIQSKIHNEIDLHIGRTQIPTRVDKEKLAFVEAVINETHRQCSLLPFSVFHRVQKDVEFNGYTIPKNVLIYPNLYEAHHNKEYWGDPEIFRPERFLDLNVIPPRLIKHDPFMPFSTGKRVCLGEVLAKDTLFLFFTGLLQQFEFEFDSSSASLMKEPNVPPKCPTFVLSPKTYKVIMKLRN